MSEVVLDSILECQYHRDIVMSLKGLSMEKLRRGRHVVSCLHAHLVFVPKYRKKIFDLDALDRLRSIFRVVCADFETDLKEFNGEEDHVHLLVEYPPKVSLAVLVGSLKGISSRRLRQERKDIARNSWKGALWSPSYFAGSVGGAPLTVLKKYIQNQKQPRKDSNYSLS